jgi:hypothetical protein
VAQPGRGLLDRGDRGFELGFDVHGQVGLQAFIENLAGRAAGQDGDGDGDQLFDGFGGLERDGALGKR